MWLFKIIRSVISEMLMTNKIDVSLIMDQRNKDKDVNTLMES